MLHVCGKTGNPQAMRENTKSKTGRHSRSRSSKALIGTASATAVLGGLIIGVAPASQAAENKFSMTSMTKVNEPSMGTIKAAKNTGPAIPMKSYDVSAGWGHSTGPHAGRSHAGLDLAASTGAPIYSSTAGKVIKAGDGGGYGNLVTIRTSDGHELMYAHMSRIGVEKGDTVEVGDQIGKVGSTGYSTGPHLHFEVHTKKGNAINPLEYLGVNQKQLVKAGK
jgi:murein DD-endopeptidase MepM/ murein hydrolase activator NlpD